MKSSPLWYLISSMSEILEIVDRDGNIIGRAKRSEIHGNNALLHRVVHLIVTNPSGDILLQKRSMKKDVAPGRWDTSVGGHVGEGEDIETALKRETEEELGITPDGARLLYTYIHKNPYESELVYTHQLTHQGPFRFDPDEIDEVRFWSLEEIKQNLGKGVFSDNFEDEFGMFMNHINENIQED